MKRLLCLSSLVVALATPCVRAQAPEPKVEFEVASVKPFSMAQTDGPITLGATFDRAQVRLVGLTLRDLLGMAYRVKPFQINGPDWLATERYFITAKMPSGVPQDKSCWALRSAHGIRVQCHRGLRQRPAVQHRAGTQRNGRLGQYRSLEVRRRSKGR